MVHILNFINDVVSGLAPAVEWLTTYRWVAIAIYVLIFLSCGYVASRVLRQIFLNINKIGKLPLPISLLLQKTLAALVWFCTITMVLSVIGVDIVSILGAAGVLGVAIGFASQTSLSNVICGVFLVSERSIQLGDYIRVDAVEGTVESINLLSVHLRQIDNSLVRVPNQLLIQTPTVNITGNDLRRCDLPIGVAYDSNLEEVRELLLQVIADSPGFLSTPAPVVQFLGFADSSLNLRVGAWCKTSDYWELRYELACHILKAFTEHGIEIPFPCRTLYSSDNVIKNVSKNG